MPDTLMAAKQLYEQRQQTGFNQDALDHIASAGLGNGAFEEDEDDISAIVDEFYPTESHANHELKNHILAERSLAEKLDRKARAASNQD